MTNCRTEHSQGPPFTECKEGKLSAQRLVIDSILCVDYVTNTYKFRLIFSTYSQRWSSVPSSNSVPLRSAVTRSVVIEWTHKLPPSKVPEDGVRSFSTSRRSFRGRRKSPGSCDSSQQNSRMCSICILWWLICATRPCNSAICKP